MPCKYSNYCTVLLTVLYGPAETSTRQARAMQCPAPVRSLVAYPVLYHTLHSAVLYQELTASTAPRQPTFAPKQHHQRAPLHRRAERFCMITLVN